MLNIVKAVKLSTTLVVGLGVNTIVTETIKTVVYKPENPLQQVTVKAAGYVISAMVADQASNFTDKAIDGAVDAIIERKKRIDLKFALAKITKGMSTFEAEGLDERMFEKDAKERWIPRKPIKTTAVA